MRMTNDNILKTPRDHSLEVYRCFLMFGICWLHAIGNAHLGYEWLANILHPCVTAFAFLSGWFGCRFRFSKLLRLYGVGFFCAAVMTTVLMQSPYVATQFGTTWLPQFCRMYKNYWFLHAYAMMMLVSPLIDSVVDRSYSEAANREVIAKLFPVVLLAFGWSFAITFKVTELWLPHPSGLGAYTGLTLIGTYAVARYMRWSGILKRISKCTALLVLIACCVLAAFKLGRYNSPIALVMAVASFRLFQGLRLPNVVGKVVLFLSPSMFSVYLLQVNDFMFPFIGDVASKWGGGLMCLILIAAALLCFGVVVDLIRRYFCYNVYKVIK